MEAVDGEPCPARLTAAVPVQPGPLDEPPPPPLDCSPLKSLSPALHGLLLSGTPLSAKRDELGLTEVSYLDTETLPLPLAAPAPAPATEPAPAPATVNCSVLMGYLRKQEDPPELAGRPLAPERGLSPAESEDPDDPEEPAAAAVPVPPPPPVDLSRTCLVCGVAAEVGRSRSLHAADPLPASGSAYLAFVGHLLDSELEPGALQRLEVICLDCHDLLVTIDDLEQRVAAMRNSVKSQFRAWWRAGGDAPAAGAAAGAAPERRRSSRRAAAAPRRQLEPPDPTDGAEPEQTEQTADDEYRPNKRRKTRAAVRAGAGG